MRSVWTRDLFWSLGIVAACMAPCIVGPASAQAGDKPNIVVILADDMGFECIGANGCEEYPTPNVDKLAAGGMRFTQCFANPLCTPSRVKLMTGRYNVRNYVKFGMLERTQKTFAHQLKAAGYATAIAGKWQLGSQVDSPRHFGFDRSCLWQHTRSRTRKGTPFDSRYPNPRIEIDGKEVDFNDGEYGPDVCSDFLCDFIKTHKDGPFLAYYPMILTHCPFDSTPDSPTWDPKSPGAKEYKGPGTAVDQKQRFGEMVTYADKMVGKIIRTLEEEGLRENTLVLFTGDNGTDTPIVTRCGGRDVVGGKGKVADNGTRVTFIASWPGVIEPSLDETQLVEFCDILPTLCDAAGAALPDDYPGDGVSLWPILTGKGDRTKDFIYVWYRGKTWCRTLDHGVLLDNETGKYEHQRYAGHYEMTPVAIDSVDGEEKEILNGLRRTIEDLAKTRDVEKYGVGGVK